MTNTVTSIAAAILNRLGISYRGFSCGKGAFFYCKIPTDGYTFDLQYDEDGTIRLWRFVGTAPISKAGKRYECRKPNYPHTAVGIEVTDEGDLSFYAEQKIDPHDSSREECIIRMIEGYVSMIANMNFEIT